MCMVWMAGSGRLWLKPEFTVRVISFMFLQVLKLTPSENEIPLHFEEMYVNVRPIVAITVWHENLLLYELHCRSTTSSQTWASKLSCYAPTLNKKKIVNIDVGQNSFELSLRILGNEFVAIKIGSTNFSGKLIAGGILLLFFTLALLEGFGLNEVLKQWM